MSRALAVFLITGIVLTTSGCTYGVRGGVATYGNTGGPVAVNAEAAGGFGIGDDSGAYSGFHMVGDVAVGYDIHGKTPDLVILSGIEGFRQPTGDSNLGFRVGASGGISLAKASTAGVLDDEPGMSGLLFATGGLRYRIAEGDHSVTFLDFGASAGPAFVAKLEDGTRGPGGFAGTLNVSVGWLRVNHFDLSFH